jgi:hypothetical protein
MPLTQTLEYQSVVTSSWLNEVKDKAEYTCIVIPLPAFTGGSTVRSAIVGMATTHPIVITHVAVACDTVPSGTGMSVMLRKKPNGQSAVNVLSSAIDPTTLTALTPSEGSVNPSNASVAANDAIYVELSATTVSTNWTGGCMTIWARHA